MFNIKETLGLLPTPHNPSLTGPISLVHQLLQVSGRESRKKITCRRTFFCEAWWKRTGNLLVMKHVCILYLPIHSNVTICYVYKLRLYYHMYRVFNLACTWPDPYVKGAKNTQIILNHIWQISRFVHNIKHIALQMICSRKKQEGLENTLKYRVMWGGRVQATVWETLGLVVMWEGVEGGCVARRYGCGSQLQ